MKKRLLVVLLGGAILVVGGIIHAKNSTAQQPREKDNLAKVVGKVLDLAGQPVAGARVYFDRNDHPMGRRRFVLTQNEGEFSIDELAPGSYTLSADKEEEGYTSSDFPFYREGFVTLRQISVGDAQTVTGLVIYTGPKGAKLVGRVAEAVTNKKVRSVSITLRRVDNPDLLYEVTTGPEGDFSILLPPVPITVEVSAPGYKRWRYINELNTPARSLRLQPGEVKRVEVLLQPTK